MTGYFDSMHSEVHATRGLEENAAMDALTAIEERVVRDVTLAAELPSFPEEYIDSIAAVVMRYGVATTPIEHLADVDDADEYRERLLRMESDLHSTFHGVAHVLGGGWDNPTRGVREIISRGEERRYEILHRERDALIAKHYPGGVYAVDENAASLVRLGETVLATWVTPSAMMRDLRGRS